MMQRALRSPTSSAATGTVILAAAAAWFLVVGQTGGMTSAPGTMGFGFAGFVALWTVMMAAMMLPAVSPVAGLYARSLSARSRGTTLVARTSALVAGYLAAWAAVGVVAFAAALAGGRLAKSHPDAAVWVGAGILAAAGIYQLSPPKERCLVHCRAPFALLFRMSQGRGPLRDLRAGLWHGAYCVGCCFALMAALIALGIMSIGWMVLLSGVVVTERGWRHGRWVTRAVAVGLIALAVIAPLHPGLVPGLHEPTAPMSM